MCVRAALCVCVCVCVPNVCANKRVSLLPLYTDTLTRLCVCVAALSSHITRECMCVCARESVNVGCMNVYVNLCVNAYVCTCPASAKSTKLRELVVTSCNRLSCVRVRVYVCVCMCVRVYVCVLCVCKCYANTYKTKHLYAHHTHTHTHTHQFA